MLTTMRAFARRLKLKLVRVLQRLSLRISSPYDFVGQALLLMAEPAFLHYLAKGDGAGQLLHGLYDLAIKEPALREYLIKTEVAHVFPKLYLPLAKDPAVQSFLVERGVDDLYRYAYVLAQQAKLPLAQRAESFSQEGEDLIIGRLFDGVQTGFFVDVGAHHPFRFSNTWLLYRRGWRGINIDATPGAMAEFHHWRPDDVNIECLVSTDTRPRPYFLHDEPALNTMSEDLVKRRAIESPQYRMRETIMLQSRTLASILEEHVPEGRTIDLLNVDVEGHDLEVLRSNDWTKFRPNVILAELLITSLADIGKSELYRFLTDRGYRLYAKMYNSAVFTAG
jgi:FkbM family methyltransferase